VRAGLILLGGDEGRAPERARGPRRTATIAGTVALALAAWAVAPVYFHIPMFIGVLLASLQAVAVGRTRSSSPAASPAGVWSSSRSTFGSRS
jgi:hypothetical protein